MDTLLFIRKHALALAFLPVACFFFFFFFYAVNIPFADDWSVLNMFCLWDGLSLVEKVKVLFAQHNEHRIATTRLFALVQYQLCGQIDVRYWMLFGNLGYVLIFYVLYQYLKKEGLIELLPIQSFLLFAPFAYGNIFNAMQNSNTLFVAFSIWLFYWIAYNKSIWGGIGIMTVLMFTNGGGFLPLFISLALLVYQKRYKEASLFGLAGFLLLALYFYSYHGITYHPDPVVTLQEQSETVFVFFFSFLGSFMKVQLLTLLMGVVLLGLFLFCLPRYKDFVFVFSILFLVILTAMSVSVNRAGFGMDAALGNRYRIYSQLFLMLLIVVGYREFAKQHYQVKVYWFLAICSFVLFFNQMVLKRAIYQKAKEERTDLFFNWRSTGHYMVEKGTSSIAQELIDKNYYRVPHPISEYVNKEEIARYKTENAKKIKWQDIHVSIDTIVKKRGGIKLVLAPSHRSLLGKGQLFVLLVRNQQPVSPTYYLDKDRDQYPFNLKILNKNINEESCKVSVLIPTKKVPSGEYEIYFKILTDEILDNDFIKLETATISI